jgi:hypothetical protein
MSLAFMQVLETPEELTACPDVCPGFVLLVSCSSWRWHKPLSQGLWLGFDLEYVYLQHRPSPELHESYVMQIYVLNFMLKAPDLDPAL